MERLSFDPLIAHLKEQGDTYNQLYVDHEIKQGPIDKAEMSKWIVRIVEPLVADASKTNGDRMPAVFKAFFTELLVILGSGVGTAYQSQYEQAWQLTGRMPQLINTAPSLVLRSVDTALATVRQYQPVNVDYWLRIMEAVAPACRSTGHLLDAGRVAAWLCGLAYLKEKAHIAFRQLPLPLQEQLRPFCPAGLPMEEAFQNCWSGSKTPRFAGEVGGFIGLEGYFTSPPLVAQKDDLIVAIDQTGTYVLFCDAFGKILLPAASYKAKEIAMMVRTDFNNMEAFYKTAVLEYQDISSWTVKDTTLYLTRHSSHYIYVYGWDRAR